MAENETVTAARLEHRKSCYDYLKHLTTLATGSIVIIATFLDKLFAQPEWINLVIVSICGFLLSVISSVVTYTLLLFNPPGSEEEEPEWRETLGGISLFLTWIGFLGGIIALAVFAIRNLG